MLKTLFAHTAMIASVALWATSSHAQITNDVFVSGTYGDDVIDAMDDESVSVAEALPNVQLTKTIDEVIDTNGSGRVDAGDTVVYRFDVLNTGNLTLNEVDISDPLADLDVSTVGPLLPSENDTTLTATYVLTQSDVDAGGVENSAEALGQPPDTVDGTPQDTVEDVSDAGDELVETAALDGTTDGDPTNDPTVLTIEQVVDLELEKSLVATYQPFPFVFDFTYQIAVQNTGTVTATDLSLADDLVSQFAPMTVMQVSAGNPIGSLVAADMNADYDGGLTDASVLSADVSLAPKGAFTFDVIVRVEVPPATFSGGQATLDNQASLNITQASDPFLSSADGTVGPVSTTIYDADLDGVVDDEEPSGDDRDGDGTGDAQDIDPTGFFYCEEDGTILSGGMISVTAITGDPSAIRIVMDGSTGAYQWYITAPGTYQMSYIPPNSVEASEDRVDSGTLSTTGAGGDAISLGSNENLTTGVLTDFTAAANPFYLTFEIAEGDPHVLNNNIPFRHCGTPILLASKSVANGPTALPDGRIELTYEIGLTNDGDSRAANIGISDPLDSVFGAGRYEVVSVGVTDAPTTFTATRNAGFEGSADTALLSSGGYLEAGEEVTVEVSLIVDPLASGDFTNTVTVSGERAAGGAALDEDDASATVQLIVPDLSEDLIISKTATPESVQVGDVVTYTIEVENQSAIDLAGLTLVDQLPSGTHYRSGSAELDGVASEPSQSGRRLSWRDFVIGSGQTRVLTLNTLIGSQAGPGDITNEAWIEDALTGTRITTIARATVRIEIEPIFDCSAVIGKVFDDRNLNGYQDPPADPRAEISDQSYNGSKGEREVLEEQQEHGEPGLPNVNILTPSGTVITTDEFGRFSVPCAELPTETGTNFSLKVDERTLPSGYRVVTENPRTMRLTAGIFAEMNFGAALGDVIEINLTAEAFDSGGRPVAGLEDSLRRLHAQVSDTYTVVRLGYYYRSEGAAEARRRLDTVEDLFERVWANSGRNNLEIERSVYAAQ